MCFEQDFSRRDFISKIGKGLALAAMTSSTIAAMLENVYAASKSVSHLTPQQAAFDEDFWFQIQQAFSISRSIINLNNGGVSPSPRIVTEALIRYTWQQEDVPAYTMWRILEPQSENVRAGLAELFECDKEEIAITRNASESLETLLLGYPMKSGDEIITTTQDYPRNITTLRQREQREGIQLTLFKIPTPSESPDELVTKFEEAITPRTKLILVSHVNFTTGQVMPIRKVCDLARSRNIEVIVDGAHSFAHLAYTVKDLGCDYFATSLHKWLHAPKGTGMLYVKREKIDKIFPLMAADKSLASDIRKFEEIGTHPAAPRLAIGEAILFYNGIGAQRKEARLRYLSRYWMNNLKDMSGVRFNTSFNENQSCAIANVDIGIDPGAVSGYLFDKHKIFTTTISIENEFKGLRITPSVYTTISELDRFCEVMETILKKGLPK